MRRGIRRGSTYIRRVHVGHKAGHYKKHRAHRSYGVRRVQKRRSSAFASPMHHRRFYKG
jgi:hypothetical protein